MRTMLFYTTNIFEKLSALRLDRKLIIALSSHAVSCKHTIHGMTKLENYSQLITQKRVFIKG